MKRESADFSTRPERIMQTFIELLSDITPFAGFREENCAIYECNTAIITAPAALKGDK